MAFRPCLAYSDAMTSATFDTYNAVKKALTDAGIGEREAEAIAETVRRVQSDLATRADIAWLKWAIGVLAGICLAAFAGTLFTAFQIVSLAARFPL